MNKVFHGRLGEAGLGFIFCSLSLYKKVHSRRSQRFSDYLKSFQTIRTGFLQEFYLHYKGIQDTCNTVGKLTYVWETLHTVFFFYHKRQNVFIYTYFYFTLAILTNYKFSISVKCVFGTSESTSVVSVQGQSDASLCLRFPKLIWRL